MKKFIKIKIRNKPFKFDHCQSLTVKELIELGGENPDQSKLALLTKTGTEKYTDLDEVIKLEDKMKFTILNMCPTTVSFFGGERLMKELSDDGYNVSLVGSPQNFVVIKEYEIESGKFQGRVVNLAFSTTPNYPQSIHPSIHVESNPLLFDSKDNQAQVRNIQPSLLGGNWRYWSINANWSTHNKQDASRLLSIVAGVFDNA